MKENSKAELWEALLDVIIKHRKFSKAHWALSKKNVDKIEEVAETLKPSNPELLYRRLFRKDQFDLLENENNYEEQLRILSERRKKAIEIILERSGIESVLSFSERVTDSLQVGIALGQIVTDERDFDVLPDFLSSNSEHKKNLVTGYVMGRFNKAGWTWVDKIKIAKWSLNEIAAFFILLPFEPETWKRVKTILGENEFLYWKLVQAVPYNLNDALHIAVEQFLKFSRPRAAIKCLYWMIHEKMETPMDQVKRALIDNISSDEEPYSVDQYACTELIKWLQLNAEIDDDILFKIEWYYIPLLDDHIGLSPKTLELHLASNPKFFLEMLKIVFKSEKEKIANEEPTEEKKKIANNAFHLLYKWKIPPGTMRDGSFNVTYLKTWVEEIKRLSSESGHLRIALDQTGKVLANSPPDPSGLWINKDVANILNSEQHDLMRIGFSSELYNKRGAFMGSGGEDERKLASDYHQKASNLEVNGYFRLAATLRDLANSYEHEAKREELSNEFEI